MPSDGREKPEEGDAGATIDEFVAGCKRHPLRAKVEGAAKQYKTQLAARKQRKAPPQSLMRGLDALIAHEALPVWCVQTLSCRADETPSFEHYTRAYIQKFEELFAQANSPHSQRVKVSRRARNGERVKRAGSRAAAQATKPRSTSTAKTESDSPSVAKPRLVLWFAGFSMTGRVAMVDPARMSGARGSRMLLETKLVWRADSQETLDAANEKLDEYAGLGRASRQVSDDDGEESAPDAWLRKWATDQLLYAEYLAKMDSKLLASRWTFSELYANGSPADPSRKSDGSRTRAESIPRGGPERRADDLFIATDDGVYLLRKEEYRSSQSAADAPAMSFCDEKFFARPDLSTPGTQRAAVHVLTAMQQMDRRAELNLAAQMINGGVDIAAIPSTGLPTRGTWCYLVHLPEEFGAR
jgi:hypothetical protein